MKLCFSTENINSGSFLGLCRLAYDYGYGGFELYDPESERRLHGDSVLRSDVVSEGKRKLLNRGLEIAALRAPYPVEDERVTAESLLRLVEMASSSGAETVILRVLSPDETEPLSEKLVPAIRKAERQGVEILFETADGLSDCESAVTLIKRFASASLGVAWNVAEAYFRGGIDAESGIRILGAYIRYVRIGDRTGETKTLLGEGTLPAEKFLEALRSLNYEGFLCADSCDEIADSDILLTQFKSCLSELDKTEQVRGQLYYNRSKTGTFPWKPYDVLDMTFGTLLSEMAERYPDQPAFRYTTLDYSRSYSAFEKDVDRVASALIALGVKPGYHVAVWASNVPQWFLTFWAAAKIGAVLVTVNTAYKRHEVEYLLRQSDTHTLVMTHGSKDSDYAQIMSELVPELQSQKKGEAFYSEALPFLRNIVTIGFRMDGCLEWDEMMRLSERVPIEEVRRRAALVKPDDVVNMQYTSGTTGFPKGVMLTHRNIINNGKIIGDRMDLSTADRMMVQVPMFHCFGMVLTMTSIMTHGGTLFPLPYFSAGASLACIRREKITCFNGVPTMFIAMFNHPDFPKTDFGSVRTGIMAGANCPPELMRRAASEMHMPEIISVYGQTEASPGCTMGEVNEDLDHRVDTVGSAFPGIECKIIDPETGKDLPDGTDGEFVVRGFNVMKGYYKMPEETAKAVDKDGWLHSGDICRRTPDGYYKVTGRLKDMIIRGGENIYPREIEEFYLTHPKIRDVQVIGVADPAMGEEICAWVIPNEGETVSAEELRSYGLSGMARHKVPRYFVFTDEFPMNAAGKVLKYKMKERFESEQK